MKALCFDIESDGLLHEDGGDHPVSKIHCINMVDSDGRQYRFTDHNFYQDTYGRYTDVQVAKDGTIRDGLHLLETFDGIIFGHRICAYDLMALEHVYPGWKLPRSVHFRDTLTMSRLLYPHLKQMDFAAIRRKKHPADFASRGYVANHSLGAWGARMGNEQKGDFKPENYGHTWATMPFTKEMDDYCMQDVVVNMQLYNYLMEKAAKRSSTSYQDAIDLECRVEYIIARQRRRGWAFDVKGAEKLAAELQCRKVELREQMQASFADFYVPAKTEPFVPKRDNARYGYVEGAPCTQVKLVEFNPGSRAHVARCLSHKYGWEPTEFTDKGKPQVSEDILSSLPWPEAELAGEFFMIAKRLGQVAEGGKTTAWLKRVTDEGRIHGKVNTLGAITTRMTHSKPNVAQCPRVGSPYGAECRSLWGVPEGYVLVGCDAEGLEMRKLAHYLARYDKGAYMRTVISGSSKDGTDAHSINQKTIGLNSRDSAKTWFYAFSYGAQNRRLGTVIVDDMTKEEKLEFYKKYPPGQAREDQYKKLGARSRGKVLRKIPALKKFIEKVKEAASSGWIRGIDGRHFKIRSTHSAPNTLLQGGSSVVMKRALVILDDDLQDAGLVPGVHYEFVGNIHDEFQIEVRTEYGTAVGEAAAEAIRKAGEYYNSRCPHAGAYSIGTNWRETH